MGYSRDTKEEIIVPYKVESPISVDKNPKTEPASDLLKQPTDRVEAIAALALAIAHVAEVKAQSKVLQVPKKTKKTKTPVVVKVKTPTKSKVTKPKV